MRVHWAAVTMLHVTRELTACGRTHVLLWLSHTCANPVVDDSTTRPLYKSTYGIVWGWQCLHDQRLYPCHKCTDRMLGASGVARDYTWNTLSAVLYIWYSLLQAVCIWRYGWFAHWGRIRCGFMFRFLVFYNFVIWPKKGLPSHRGLRVVWGPVWPPDS